MISKDGESGPSRYFYEENGLDHTKALLSALGDRGKELGLDALGGFLSGLFLSGAKGGYNAVQFNRMGKEAFDTGSYRDYISLGLLADQDTEAYRYAEEIQAKLNAGREVTNIEMGQLTAAVYAEALGVGEKRSAETREEQDDRTLREYVKSTLDDFQTDLERAFMEEEGRKEEIEQTNENDLREVDNLNRTTGNSGVFASLPERMSKKHVRTIAKEFTIPLKGITIIIDADANKMQNNFIYTGRADPQTIGRIDFFPKAFQSKEELLRTLFHERVHVLQFRKYGSDYVQKNRVYFEKLTYDAENEFINQMKEQGLL